MSGAVSGRFHRQEQHVGIDDKSRSRLSLT